LIFQWGIRAASLWRLSAFIFVALLGHAVFFYLFKVISPAATRKVPAESNIMLLRMGDSEAAAVLRQLEHKVPGPFVPSPGTKSLIMELPALSQPYTPSYTDYRSKIELSALPPSELPALISPNRAVLPPIEESDASSSPQANHKPGPSLELPDRLKKRGMEVLPVWPKWDPVTDLETPRLPVEVTLGITPQGEVEHVFVESPEAPPGLEATLKAVRFNPVAENVLSWEKIRVFR
jgi:hypothetical protein